MLLLLTKLPQQGHNLINQKDQLFLHYFPYHLSSPSSLSNFLRSNGKESLEKSVWLYQTSENFCEQRCGISQTYSVVCTGHAYTKYQFHFSAILLWKHFSFDGMGLFQHPRKAQILPHLHPQKLAPAGTQLSTAHAPRGTSSRSQIQAASVPASLCGWVTSLRAPSKARHWLKNTSSTSLNTYLHKVSDPLYKKIWHFATAQAGNSKYLVRNMKMSEKTRIFLNLYFTVPNSGHNSLKHHLSSAH